MKWGGPAGSVWKAPFGGRSTPVIHNGRVYVLNPTHKHEDTKNRPFLQERLMSLDADGEWVQAQSVAVNGNVTTYVAHFHDTGISMDG